MRVLFIGGTGNISTECAALLHERGHEILVIGRKRSSVPAAYQAIEADRKNANMMRTALKGVRVEVIVNFLGYELADVQLDYALFNGSIRQYVFISSATVYAKPSRKLPITEDAALGNAFWDYAQKKLECENWLRERYQKERFPATIVRPSHTYSKLWVPNPVASSSFTFAARLQQGKPVFVPDDGENPWTLTAASDFAVGLAGLIGKTEAVGEAFHITSDEVLTWNQIYSEINDALKQDAQSSSSPSAQVHKIPTDFICQIAPQLTGNLKGDKSHPGIFDNSKIKRFVPEFQCKKPFRVGIRESVSWLRAHPEQQNLNPQMDAMFDQVIRAWQSRG